MSDPIDQRATQPPLLRDVSFHGMNLAQFLGAFNDNLLKQMVLLLCVDFARQRQTSDGWQGVAVLIFSLPFVLFSGFAGFLADRHGKHAIIRLCKIAEIGIMLAGVGALWRLTTGGAAGQVQGLVLVLAVLGLMGTHSAFFGPAKFGILPELLRPRDLPAANGLFLMATFVAIILGQTLAGWLKDSLADQLWLGSLVGVGIAAAGTIAARLIRPLAPAHPRLRFSMADLLLSRAMIAALRQDVVLLQTLLVSSLFWFLGSLANMIVNNWGKNELGLSDRDTGLLLACIALGIAGGCIAGGMLSRGRANFTVFFIGGWGLMLGALGLTIPALLAGGLGNFQPVAAPGSGSLWKVPWALGGLLVLGVSAGLFSVPLQVLLQARAPAAMKGRIIGAMNLFNWLAIFLSAGVYALLAILSKYCALPPSLLFGFVALLLPPVLIGYRPNAPRPQEPRPR